MARNMTTKPHRNASDFCIYFNRSLIVSFRGQIQVFGLFPEYWVHRGRYLSLSVFSRTLIQEVCGESVCLRGNICETVYDSLKEYTWHLRKRGLTGNMHQLQTHSGGAPSTYAVIYPGVIANDSLSQSLGGDHFLCSGEFIILTS